MDAETRALDAEILAFIKKSGRSHDPGSGFERLALRIFGYQFRRNENYQKFCLSEGKTPKEVTHWREIPAMPTAGFKELVLSTFPLKECVKIFKTSGTTEGDAPATKASAGAPLRGAHFFDTLTLYEASILPPFKKYLMPETQGFSFFFLTSSPQDSSDSSLCHMMGVVNSSFTKNKGRFYVQKGILQYEALARDLKSVRKVAFLLATAFSLKSFLDYLRSEKIFIDLPKGSRLMETGGFKGRTREVSKPKFYAECQARLSIPREFCVSEYGMTELSSQFYDTTLRDKVLGVKRRPFKEGPAWIRTRVVDPRTNQEAKKGSAGILRHFDLTNRGSVMAVQTEDMGRAVGDGFELLGRAPESELRGCSLSYEDFLRMAP